MQRVIKNLARTMEAWVATYHVMEMISLQGVSSGPIRPGMGY